MDHATPRVNSKLLPDYKGRTVRLACKVEQVRAMSAIVRASDHGQIEVKLNNLEEIQGSFVEIIGTVEDDNVIKAHACIDLGSDLDLDLVDDCINLMHQPRYESMF